MAPSSVEAQGALFGAVPERKPKTPRAKAAVKPKAIKKKLVPVALPPGKKRWLSATALSSMERCPRCFWLQQNMRLYQPEGIVSRLANRFDGVIKQYFNLYRGTPELPPMVAGKIEGRLESPFQEVYFVGINSKFGYMGKLDECVVREDGTYTPVDHKTASSDPNTKELLPAYQFQLDSYAYLLQQNRKPPSGVGHLVYFYPDEGPNLHEGFPMQITVKTLEVHPEVVRPRIDAAIELLSGDLPQPAESCPFCTYVETVKSFS